ncbi:MAG: hypothetical protein QG599_907, partial [Pseudomonadota bacterium]|nr:hypothetical protein [Pseudomonadota bacterium]
FATMAEWLEPAKVQYAGSAHYLDHIEAINLTAEQQAFIKEIPDPYFRASVWDFMVNQQFRRDYWVKGARRLNALDQAEALRQQRVMLVVPRVDVPLKVTGAVGEATLTDAIYNPLLDSLADHKPKTVGQLEAAVRDQGITFAQVLQAVMVLTGAGHLVPVQDDTTINKVQKSCSKLNTHLIQQARGSSDISYLTSPLTGGGITVGRFPQLFLLARSQGHKQPADWAQVVWQLLAAQGQRIIKDGQTLDSAEANLAELTAQAQTFADKQLPILKALQIA